ncbi:MAG: hydroxyproline-2-epimerase [Acidobacteria bacterium]|nr:MAG: hydroxyproline-2-epimerase [Acidobacteriota bacterium]REK02414.1 MAG: hydroxyproline-2-epimerase [Acidobacteriota bacterium]REK15406.1 MAG: hydroxyproline-2-epimerase [Acidobacteriota bacterium]REK42125.1 MAG: hydroxyproline-2-epimerase [Acidobacteriota bacterium]
MTLEPLTISVLDSHTEGEPTRVVTGGFPELSGSDMKAKLGSFERDYDQLRSAIIAEPRGHSAMVGALLLDPIDPENDCGVIFFDNAGYLGMCGHGTIGLVRTLEYIGEADPGTLNIETVVGVVSAELHSDGSVSVRNVPSYRLEKGVPVGVPGFGEVKGDIAWGGNWFFLIEEHPFEIGPSTIGEMTAFTTAVKNALADKGLTGEGGAEIDHVELFSQSETADSRNFVLCPGNDYDRSPCGTGTSAKIACLYADGKLDEGEKWFQESVIGSRFEASFEIVEGKLIPTIRGTARVTSRAELIIDPNDPFAHGIGKDSLYK